MDQDFAELYKVETKHLKRQVRRNIERFPVADYMFQLSLQSIRFQGAKLAP
ncbi:ORF6N domain-containing protein [Mucilaginibacter pallidiroseus]|uniref:ORF6N domain-containing protein n=1 Tax=Mucilaginibacter pallidiroseus TaxID=2599295 RepID=UPI003704AB4E